MMDEQPAAETPEQPDHEAEAETAASDVAPDEPVQNEAAEQLRTALGEMRAEADRIAELGTGADQVAAAEQFAEDAGRLDEQIGAAARAADDDDRR